MHLNKARLGWCEEVILGLASNHFQRICELCIYLTLLFQAQQSFLMKMANELRMFECIPFCMMRTEKQNIKRLSKSSSHSGKVSFEGRSSFYSSSTFLEGGGGEDMFKVQSRNSPLNRQTLEKPYRSPKPKPRDDSGFLDRAFENAATIDGEQH